MLKVPNVNSTGFKSSDSGYGPNTTKKAPKTEKENFLTEELDFLFGRLEASPGAWRRKHLEFKQSLFSSTRRR